MYRFFIRKLLFLLKPEAAHTLVCFILRIPFISKILRRFYRFEHYSLQQQIFGLQFKNPIGLAAGFDKNAKLINQMADLGFGFIEIGTVTPKPQKGNPKPRMFRLLQDGAIINRMGFNNKGVNAVVKRLKKKRGNILIGGNIGKNKTTPNSEAFLDYEFCFDALKDVVDYFVINVSSPNTPGLRELQDRKPLTQLLQHIKMLNNNSSNPKPILLKIAPDLSNSHLDTIVEIVKETKIDGIIATNTTISREDLMTTKGKLTEIGEGGLSGKPLTKRSTEVIRYLYQRSNRSFPIIGVGGIHSPEDAIEKLNAGASLIQLYTGFIYEGPGLIKKIKQELAKLYQTS
jgi:dihydroorotate dehydrogenase